MTKPTTPLLAADIIIELADRPGRPIVLVDRRYPPLGWAIPGGFVDVGERIEAAAIREAQEETGLAVELVALLGLYSDPSRDARGHTASAVYLATARGVPHAHDDARAVQICEAGQWPAPLVFDHATILADYLIFRQSGRLSTLRSSF